MNKRNVILQEICTINPDIVLICESWMHDAKDCNLFNFDDYVAFADCREDRRGGGVLVLVKSALRPSAAKHHVVQHRCNVVAVNIGVAAHKTVVCCAYRPPNTSAADSELFLEHLQAINDSAVVRIFAGDFNYPYINWNDFTLTKRDSINNVFQCACDEMGLTQCVTDNTLGDHILDLVLLSHPSSLQMCSCCPPIATSDHLSVQFSVSMDRATSLNILQPARLNFDKADLQLAARQLATVNWRNVFARDRHVDDYVYSFMSVLTTILSQCTPNIRQRPNKPKRIVPKQIRALILKKRRLWKKVHDVNSLQAYQTACDDVKRATHQYISHWELDLVSHPKQAAFYKYINRSLGKQHSAHQLVANDGAAITDDVIAANMFNDEFVSNFTASDPCIGDESEIYNSPDLSFNASFLDTYSTLASSKNSSPGPDGIAGYVLRTLAYVLALPVSIIFQQSLAQGTFPTAWKSAIVVPVYKGKGTKGSASSYRPISLCSTIGKALERIVRDQILSTVAKTKPLCRWQHGFTEGRSTISSMLCTDNEAADALNSKHPYDIITFDFSRAFDRVPHHLLLTELANHGVTGTALRWVRSFLTDRTQLVRISTAMSASAAVTSGVIQGSSLGTTLFTIYIDQLLAELDIPASAYADDLEFIANVVRHQRPAIQANINRVHDWSKARGMPLSVDKCFVLHCGASNPRHPYHCGHSALPEADSITELGVIRSSDGTFTDHISAIAKRGRQLVGHCFRAIQCRDPAFMLRIYQTYILPKLTYASPIWSPHLRQEIDELEAVQRRFTKRLTGQAQLSYATRLTNLSLLSLESQRRLSDYVTIYKLCHNMLGVTLNDVGLSLSANNTRGGGLRLQQHHTTSVSSASHFKYRAGTMWNALPYDIIRQPSLSLFKNAVKTKMHDDDLAYFD